MVEHYMLLLNINTSHQHKNCTTTVWDVKEQFDNHKTCYYVIIGLIAVLNPPSHRCSVRIGLIIVMKIMHFSNSDACQRVCVCVLRAEWVGKGGISRATFLLHAANLPPSISLSN